MFAMPLATISRSVDAKQQAGSESEDLLLPKNSGYQAQDAETFELAHVVARRGRGEALEVERPRADATQAFGPLAGLVVVAHGVKRICGATVAMSARLMPSAPSWINRSRAAVASLISASTSTP